jgi:hypothetical protein
MRQIARLIWSIETAQIPMRLSDLHIQATREGTDQLNVKMLVSALYMRPTSTNSQGIDEFYDMEQMQ